MIRVCLAAAIMVVSTAAGAAPFDGRWALAGDDCRNEPGSGERVPVTIGGNKVDFYESVCEIGAIEPIGAQESAWRVTRTCRGEGETWTVRSIFAIDRDTAGSPLQLIEIDVDNGYVIVRQHCE